jgi:hypothetical protein
MGILRAFWKHARSKSGSEIKIEVGPGPRKKKNISDSQHCLWVPVYCPQWCPPGGRRATLIQLIRLLQEDYLKIRGKSQFFLRYPLLVYLHGGRGMDLINLVFELLSRARGIGLSSSCWNNFSIKMKWNTPPPPPLPLPSPFTLLLYIYCEGTCATCYHGLFTLLLDSVQGSVHPATLLRILVTLILCLCVGSFSPCCSVCVEDPVHPEA